MEKDDKYFMGLAVKEANKALEADEVPIGAVVTIAGKVISKAHNTRNKTQNAINHAEVIAISKACKKLKSWRLEGAKIYVTLEPCPMCLGAILNARIDGLVFGAYDKTGNEDLMSRIISSTRLNHKTTYVGGVLEDECSKLLSDFFAKKRNKTEK